MKILNFGSLNIDYVYKVDHFVRSGETLSSDAMDIFSGGKGLNQSIALVRAGADAIYHAGGIGKSDGGFLKNILLNNHVNVDLVREFDSPTGHAIIQIDKFGENCILLYGGTNQLLTEAYIDEVLENFQSNDFIVLQNEINLLDYIIRRAHQKEMKIFLNPSPINEKIFGLSLDYVDYLILNEVEAGELCPNTEKSDLLNSLSEKYPNAKIILTLGEAGVAYKDGNNVLRHGIYDVAVVDTTAAGDTFTGYFISAISNGHEPTKALEIASIAAAIAVSRNGAEPSIPYLGEVLNSDLHKRVT